jgi:hypothetical protein
VSIAGLFEGAAALFVLDSAVVFDQSEFAFE